VKHLIALGTMHAYSIGIDYLYGIGSARKSTRSRARAYIYCAGEAHA